MASAKLSLEFSESFENNFIRLITYLIREALKQLAASPLQEATIHEARLLFKRSRSLIRMARFGLTKDEARRLDHFFRDQGRALAKMRDKEVILEVLKPILKNIPDGEEKNILIRFRADLMNQRKKRQENNDLNSNTKEMVYRLSRMLDELSSYRPNAASSRIFLTGTRINFSECRRRLKRLKRVKNDQALHNWRKELKFLLYQMELIQDVWPVRFGSWIVDLKTLSQALGRHHDLVLLESALHDFIPKGTEQKIPIALTMIREEKTRIEGETITLGKKFFSMSGTCFFKQIISCAKEAGFTG